MSARRNGAITAAAFVLLIGGVTPVHGQGLNQPRDPRLDFERVAHSLSVREYGPLALFPLVRLHDVGVDSNVFGQNEAQDPKSDIIATLTPALVAWFRLPRARVSGRTQFDFVYFNEFSNLRSIDTDNSVRMDFLLKFFRPYVAASFAQTRHGRNLEIDAPVWRRTDTVTVGADFRLTGKSSIDLSAGQSHEEYKEHSYLQNDLARNLNRTMTGEALTFRYAATPLTAVGVSVERQRDRFEFSPERDADEVTVSSLFEFRPDAVISGRAQVGIQERTSVGVDASPLRGTFVRTDLRYTLLGTTQFTVWAQRDLDYSYYRAEEYQGMDFNVSVAHRFSTAWDVRARVGRDRLAYLRGGFGQTGSQTETITRYGVDAGYRLARMRLGAEVTYTDRRSEISARRESQRLLVTSSVTYAFD